MRPDFITEEQIARWDENISKDDALKEVVTEKFAEQESLREVLYASLWLYDEMERIGISKFVIGAAQYVLGQESFGKDPWEVAQAMFETYVMIKNKEDENVS